ncbi:acetyl-CoA carboxylase biotin carboxyl carrier protein [Cardinium endosymbiont of Culicoides punctatus]|uniref:acetyl-CoA carboxylase biotin carboxyl carrier protein n=1 Tax=Cardinium endosymbiont of Culicoides punctatus TaxID=2304601 RepID=UPI001058583E|nr:acetyl-CoA carboxylase biotin carboxyl carrier protein [Cardinium endosymbiont of Culicoides punctatus]TDG95599.1 Biotin carboxyl carrier protein of acetyl-CoA carboxylase [Cardinium endosymbiont of Culicoides punctatus]
MKTTEIQELIEFITQSGLEEVSIETEAIKIHIKRSIPVPQYITSSTPTSLLPSVPNVPIVSVDTHPTTMGADHIGEANYITIKSPMVGTFYRSPNPDAPPFVQVGDSITKGTKLCIIEAMKLYNEIEAEINGKIVKVLLDDISPVEYDQPLFLVDPA